MSDRKERENGMKKRIGFLALAVVAICALFCVTAFAAAADTAAQNLSTVGIFRGTNDGFELGRAPTRNEAAVMLVRLLGKEQEAGEQFSAGSISQPFTDVSSWAEPYIAWLYTNGLTRGSSPTAFGGGRSCSAKDYAVFLMRALGYQDGTDFTYADAESFASETGIYSADLFSGTFTRGDLALMSEYALGTNVKGGEENLLETLIDRGAVAEDAAGQLREALAAGQSLRITKSDVSLDEDAWNAACQTMAVTVHFNAVGSAVPAADVTLTGDQLKSLMASDGAGRVTLQPQALEALVAGWRTSYDKADAPLVFDSYVKGPVALTYIRCSYRFDGDKLEKALRQQLYSLESGTVSTDYVCCSKEGKPLNLESSHVEVDIDNQQLTLIRNGRVVVNTNIVTGALTGHQTPTGLYWAHHKRTDTTLTGADYSVFVNYWISVVGDSIGLHDASWRWAFGGDNYVNGGSHGCVNIPVSVMPTIYANVYDGMPVIIHGRNVWYSAGHSPATVNPTRGTTAKK